MKTIGKLFAGIVGGIVVALLSYFVLSLALASGGGLEQDNISLVIFGVWGFMVLVSILTKRPARAWRVQFILASLLCFSLPLSSVVFTGASMIDVVDQSAPALIGTFVGGSLVTMLAGVTGFFMGLILLVIGLLIGRENAVIIVNQSEKKDPSL
ncbi:MAG: hypothetical protein QGE95_15325 [Arenicellales bacterium]|jgi:hypothetical protein|nr:hypothetical protein [Arenicellales bacterium]MDP7453625.1 hypothetical protein [Arenicellales bacterium]HJP45927.1 hypothetical protein [Arenicellales bacterium]|tara:strand:+ start:117 stop:578 length:462 start_codon:yes stop_codon:yes gene_type:complete